MHPRFDAKTAETRIFLFAKRRDSQPYFDLLFNRMRAQATGAFVANRDGSGTMIVDAGRAFATDRTAYHELMHNILAASGARLPSAIPSSSDTTVELLTESDALDELARFLGQLETTREDAKRFRRRDPAARAGTPSRSG